MGEGEGGKKEEEAGRRICHLAWHPVPLAHRKFTSHRSKPQKFLLDFLLQKSLKADCFNRKGSSFPREDKQESCSWSLKVKPWHGCGLRFCHAVFWDTQRVRARHWFPALLRFHVHWLALNQPPPSFEAFLWVEAGLVGCLGGAMCKCGAVLWLNVELLGSLYWGSPLSPSLAEHTGQDPLSKALSIPP